MYHITNKEFNAVKSIRYAKKEYAKWKRNFIQIATDLGIDGDAKTLVDKIIEKWQADKPKTNCVLLDRHDWFRANKKRSFTVVDTGNKFYSLTESLT